MTSMYRLARFIVGGTPRLLWVVAVASTLGCTGSETGNAGLHPTLRPVAVEMALAQRDASAATATSSDGVTLSPREAWARVESVDFYLAEGDLCAKTESVAQAIGGFVHDHCAADGSSISIEGPWEVDLITGHFAPPLEGLTLPEVPFERVKVKMKSTRDVAALEVAGTYQVDGASRDFAFSLDGTIPAKFEASAPLVVSDGVQGLSLDLVFQDWAAAVVLRSCTADAEAATQAGDVVVLGEAGARHCAPLANAVRRHLVSNARLEAR